MSATLVIDDMIAFLTASFPGTNIVDDYQTVQIGVVYPTIVVKLINSEIVPTQRVALPPFTGPTQTYAWGYEKAALQIEILHNNQRASKNLATAIKNLFLKPSGVSYGMSNFALMNYKSAETNSETAVSHYLSFFSVDGTACIQVTEDTNRMETIDLRVTAGVNVIITP